MDTHTAPDSPTATTSVDVVVIGGGQAGLATGHALLRTGRSFVILDANPRVGDAWRNRWDSLVLFTPSQYNRMPGMRYPAPDGTFCTKDEFADFLESYAEHFDLPVRLGTRVTRLSRVGGRFRVQTDRGTYEADDVVVAMSTYQRPRIPSFARDLAPHIHQLHAAEYRNVDQLPDGRVLLVGAGNSGADIAMDVVSGHDTVLAGDPPGVIPFRIETWMTRHVTIRLVHVVGHRILNVNNPIGRKVKPIFTSRGTPLIRVKPQDLLDAGVERVGRITGVTDGLPATEDGTTLDVATVIWCTGFRTAFSWIDLPILSDHGEPEHDRGVVREIPGLYFIGLEFLQSETSGTITGLARDTRRIVRLLDRRPRPTPADLAERVEAVA